MDISVLLGKTLVDVVGGIGDSVLKFVTSENENYVLIHEPECSEDVSINDIVGDISDLLGSPITMAEEVSNENVPRLSSHIISHKWTFYRLATIKGYVTLRWLGQSNGYYSESVEFRQVDNDFRY